jgi:hypothetical protein
MKQTVVVISLLTILAGFAECAVIDIVNSNNLSFTRLDIIAIIVTILFFWLLTTILLILRNKSASKYEKRDVKGE